MLTNLTGVFGILLLIGVILLSIDIVENTSDMAQVVFIGIISATLIAVSYFLSNKKSKKEDLHLRWFHSKFVVIFILLTTGLIINSTRYFNLDSIGVAVSNDVQAQTRLVAGADVLKMALVKAQSDLDKQLPKKIDSLTIFEAADHTDTSLNIYYKIEKRYSFKQEKEFQLTAKKMISESICNSGMAMILKIGGIINVYYKNIDNKPFANFTVDRSSCV